MSFGAAAIFLNEVGDSKEESFGLSEVSSVEADKDDIIFHSGLD